MNNPLVTYRVLTLKSMQDFIYVYVNACSGREAMRMVAHELGYELAGLEAKRQPLFSDTVKHMRQFGRGYLNTRELRDGLHCYEDIYQCPFVRVLSREEKLDKLLSP